MYDYRTVKAHGAFTIDSERQNQKQQAEILNFHRLFFEQFAAN
jgi:hypothetical protein